MKKLWLLGLLVLGLSLMSVSPNIEAEEAYKKYPLITHTCPDGYEFDYYDINYSDADHADIRSSACSDSQNQAVISEQ